MLAAMRGRLDYMGTTIMAYEALEELSRASGVRDGVTGLLASLDQQRMEPELVNVGRAAVLYSLLECWVKPCHQIALMRATGRDRAQWLEALA